MKEDGSMCGSYRRVREESGELFIVHVGLRRVNSDSMAAPT